MSTKDKQTKLENSINRRAQDKYNQAFEALQTFINQNPIAREAKIKIGENETISLRSLFSYHKDFETYGNGVETKAKVIEDFEAKEVSELHQKLDSLNYLFH